MEPDQGLLLAWARATTGANEHDMSRVASWYKRSCRIEDATEIDSIKRLMYTTLRRLRKQDGYDRFQR